MAVYQLWNDKGGRKMRPYEREFFTFLSNELVLGQYKAACEESFDIPWDEYFDKDTDPRIYIASAFRYHSTPEGDEFWWDVNDKWQDYLKELEGGKVESNKLFEL